MPTSRLGILFLFCFGAILRADDATLVRQEIEATKARIAALETARAEEAQEDPGLTAMKKRSTIRIGGEVEIDCIALRRDDGDSDGDGNPNGADEKGDMIDSTQVRTDDAYLSFEIRADENVSLHLLLDLDDFWLRDGNTVAQDDLLEECYFLWENVRGAPVDLAFGKKTLDYGTTESIGITKSLQEGWAYWLTQTEQTGTTWNVHTAVGTNDLPVAEPWNLFQIEAQVRIREFARLVFAVFQNNDSTGAGAATRGMHEDRSDDTLLLQSFSGKLELTPKEGLTLQASFVNWHNNTRGDGEIQLAAGTVARADDSSSDKQSVSLGFAYDAKCLPVSLFGQYQHGWNWTYNDRTNADTLSLGAIWHATERIDFGLMGERAWLDDAFGYEEENYGQAAVNVAYNFESGMQIILEYAHAWYDGDRTGNGEVEREADMFGLRTAWDF